MEFSSLPLTGAPLHPLNSEKRSIFGMSRPIEAVKDINDSKDLWKIAVRCKHMWTVTSASNKEHIEMVLVDSKLDLIQAIVPSYLVPKFKMSTKHNCKLVFCGSTSVKKMDIDSIPSNYLNILGLDAIVEGKFQSNLLVDVIGGVTEISQSQIIPDNNKSKVVFTLTDMSKNSVQCTLWGQLVVQLYEYYTNNKDDGNIVVLLINARIKEAQGAYPLNVSNAWSGTRLLINDVSVNEINELKESLKNELPLLSSSSLQVDVTQNSQFSEFDKFVWKAQILSLEEIAILRDSGWFYDGCVECTRSVSLKDGKLMCYSKHVSAEPVPRFRLDVLASDGKFKYKFIFWDVDCVKLIGKSALQMKTELIKFGEYDPLEFPYELDSILKKEFAIRAVFLPNKAHLSVIAFKCDEDIRKRIRDSFKTEEHTSKLQTPDHLSQEDLLTISEPISASADYDPTDGNSALTPSKRSLTDAVDDLESVQLSSTKLTKDIKMEK
ncbi:uncharacterized protein LOC131619340 [Vicia villosa]|uniref:uncharacterized protein LOC131619340 n=1 Tax=Vicia villosa TaxID=3911 RepID=UPI00273BF875|nr:uncharacterized protein LOC131619340 [Vicia villosa]